MQFRKIDYEVLKIDFLRYKICLKPIIMHFLRTQKNHFFKSKIGLYLKKKGFSTFESMLFENSKRKLKSHQKKPRKNENNHKIQD